MLFKFKYPKIALLIIFIILAYLVFINPTVASFVSRLGELKYLGVFVAGLFFPFGFTAPFATGFFITLNPQNILLSGIIGGLGALISNLLTFNLIKLSFKEEFNRIEKAKTTKEIENFIDHRIHKKMRMYLLYAFIGIIIASPLPDEAGIILLSGFTKVKQHIVGLITFILSTIGITILLSI